LSPLQLTVYTKNSGLKKKKIEVLMFLVLKLILPPAVSYVTTNPLKFLLEDESTQTRVIVIRSITCVIVLHLTRSASFSMILLAVLRQKVVI